MAGTGLTIQVDGELVRQGLENVAAEIPLIGRRRIRTVANRIVRRMQEYPDERPGQAYKRTGRLFYSWKIEEVQDGYRISNTAAFRGRPYAAWVVGDAYGTRQAWMHKGRWHLYRDVTEEEIAKLPPEIVADINLVARRVGL
jgi:hypothetical protein